VPTREPGQTEAAPDRARTGLTRPVPGFVPFSREALEASIPARFAVQVAGHPDRVAVAHARGSLTYRDLDHASNGIAAALMDAMGDAEEPVGLLVGEDDARIIAILGALKAGKMYLALDPGDPPDRISAMLRHSTARMVLTDDPGQASRLLEGTRTMVRDTTDLAPLEALPSACVVGPDRGAYLFYTSGSTGEPKGVCDTHRNVLHNVLRYTNSLQISCGDRLSLLQACTFSGTVSSLFGALLNGATICPIHLRRHGAAAEARWLARQDITIYHSVPALFDAIVSQAGDLPRMRIIRLEGDQAHQRHVRLFQERFGSGCILVNGLGATETGLIRQYFVHADRPPAEGVVPVGYATPEMDILLLDPGGVEVRAGEIGRIAVRSRYLAREYWRNPALTAEVFRPCPDDPAKRIYWSGDLGRKSPDGCLEHLGRLDGQVRVRGIGASLPDIEAVLGAVAGVRMAIVKPHRQAGVERLTGYIVPSEGAPPTASAIRRQLAQRLHRPLIPSRLVVLDALPLDPHGKVDRRALPPARAVRPDLDVPFRSPAGDRETRIAAIWRAVLELPEVGRDDDFFDLGGDSLDAMAVLSGVEAELGIALPHSVWVTRRTIADLAGALAPRSSTRCLVPLREDGAGSPLFLVHGHNGQVSFDLATLSGVLEAGRPVYGIEAVGLDGVEPPLGSIGGMAARYIADVREVQPAGPYALGGYCLGALVALEMAQQLFAAGEQVECLVMIDPDPVDSPGVRRTESREQQFSRHAAELRGPGGLSHAVHLAAVGLRSAKRRLASSVLSALLSVFGPRRALVPSALRPLVLPTMHGHAARHYRPQSYCGRSVLVVTEHAPGASEDGGWRRLLAGDLVVEIVRGQHDRLLAEPTVRDVAAAMARPLQGSASCAAMPVRPLPSVGRTVTAESHRPARTL
jgi:amino acid adenylation domain-containing protein